MNEQTKHETHRGVTFVLKEDDGRWGYRLSRHIGGMGYQSEVVARKAAKKAVDRMLEREKAKA